MPIYEYDCKKCKKQVEVFVPRADSKPECPDCGSRDMSKLLSVAKQRTADALHAPAAACSETEIGQNLVLPHAGESLRGLRI